MERRGEYVAGIDRLEIATALDSNNPWARLDHARFSRIQGQYAQANEDIKSVKDLVSRLHSEPEIFALLNLEQGLVEHGLGNFKKSEELLSQLVYDRTTSNALKLLATQSLSEILLAKGRWNELQFLLDQFDPEHYSQSTWALIRARLLLGQNRVSDALSSLNVFLESNPEVIKAR